MTLHNYRSRQVHKTLNGVNPSSSFRDMRSAKSGPNLWQIWQVFGPRASPYGANGQITMTVHNYRPRQFHRTSNGENPSSGYRDMGSASLAAARPAARPPEPWRQYPSSPKGWGVKSTKLTLLVMKPDYSVRTRRISLLMPWKHESPLTRGLSQYKDVVLPYRDPHVKDKTVSRPSYL